MIVNPILRGFNPDPCICRVGEDYYIAVSTFEWFPGVRIYHSRDLVHWRLAATPLNRVSQLNMLGNPDSGGVWAPCLTHADGKFWLVYSDIKVLGTNSFKDGGNFLVVCDRVDGEWSDPVYLNNVGFDASLFHDDDGRKYLLNMIWDHRPGHHHFFGISLQEYSPVEQRLLGERKCIFKGTRLRLTEGPHLYKWNGMYYLLTAEGGTRYEHAATLARSPRIDGDYEVHPENPLLSSWHTPFNPLQKAGHASIVETHNGKWYLAHLTGRPVRLPWEATVHNRGYCPLGRETALQRLEWRDGWPYVVGGNSPSLEVDDPGLPETKWESDWPGRDDFDSPVLNPNFQTLRIPFNGRIGSLEERPGHLRLYGRESPQSTFVQAHVARRWQSLNFSAETSLEFRPECFQQMAGLICYYNTTNWVYAFICFDEVSGRRILDIMQCDRGRLSAPLDGQVVDIPDSIGKVGIRVKARGDTFRFSHSFDFERWTALPPRFESTKLSDDYIEHEGFFTGAFVGMSCNDLTGAGLHADFDYFSYEEMTEA